MATHKVIFEFGIAPGSGGQGAPQVMEFQGAKIQELTSSGSSQQTAITCPFANTAGVVHNNGPDLVWVTFGSDPTASVPNVSTDVASPMRPVMPNSSFTFAGLQKGWKGALIDDS